MHRALAGGDVRGVPAFFWRLAAMALDVHIVLAPHETLYHRAGNRWVRRHDFYGNHYLTFCPKGEEHEVTGHDRPVAIVAVTSAWQYAPELAFLSQWKCLFHSCCTQGDFEHNPPGTRQILPILGDDWCA